MKTPDYEHLARIHQNAASAAHDGETAITPWELVEGGVQKARIDGMQAAIEEYERLRMEQAAEGMPSVEDCVRLWHECPGINAGVAAVRALIISAFARKMGADNTGNWAAAAAQDLTAAKQEIANLTARFEACDQARKNACDDRDAARAKLEKAGHLAWGWRALHGGPETRSVLNGCADGLERILKAGAAVEESEQRKAKKCLETALQVERQLREVAEGRLAEIAKLPAKWNNTPCGSGLAGQIYREQLSECAKELRGIINSELAAEEVSRAEFEAEWRVYCPGDDFTVDEKVAAWHMWQARAAKEERKPEHAEA